MRINNLGWIAGIVLIVASGLVGEVFQPGGAIGVISDHNEGVAAQPVSYANVGDYNCPPDPGWKRTDDFVADTGTPYVACEKNGIILRYFTKTHEEQALDTTTYPAKWITPADAKAR